MGANGCLNKANETSAWSCNLPVALMPMQVRITARTDTSPDTIVLLGRPRQENGLPRYGTQPPVISEAQKLSQVIDLGDETRGPSYFFQMPYNKLVILPNSFRPASSTKRSLQQSLEAELAARDLPSGQAKVDLMAQRGDRPWYCYWNNTLLEGFIYVTQDSSENSASSTTGGPTTSLITNSLPARHLPANDGPIRARSTASKVSYPKKFKLIERRLAGGQTPVQPYCVQMQVLDDLSVGPVPADDHEDPMVVNLSETIPPPDPNGPLDRRSDDQEWDVLDERDVELDRRERMNDGSCKCIWLGD
jgi:hypothetical protein